MTNKPTVRNTHTLVSMSFENRTGECDKCGPVSLVKCGKKGDVQYWGCSYAHQHLDRNGNVKVRGTITENRTTIRNGHEVVDPIFGSDEEKGFYHLGAPIGTCKTCGPVPLVRCGGAAQIQYWACSSAYPRTTPFKGDRHALTEINPEKFTAICAQCGPTQVVKNGEAWRCRFGSGRKPKADLTHPGPKRHNLLSMDIPNRKGVCERCGPVNLTRKGFVKGVETWGCFEANKHRSLRWRFGLSPEDYEKMRADQKDLCSICGQPDPRQRLAVDHDHATGKIRALLCESCNQALGKMKDSPALLRAAADYIERHAVSCATPDKPEVSDLAHIPAQEHPAFRDSPCMKGSRTGTVPMFTGILR